MTIQRWEFIKERFLEKEIKHTFDKEKRKKTRTWPRKQERKQDLDQEKKIVPNQDLDQEKETSFKILLFFFYKFPPQVCRRFYLISGEKRWSTIGMKVWSKILVILLFCCPLIIISTYANIFQYLVVVFFFTWLTGKVNLLQAQKIYIQINIFEGFFPTIDFYHARSFLSRCLFYLV